MIFTFLIIISSVALPGALTWDSSITINVEPLKEDCFYQTLQVNDELEIDYQVIDGGHGDLDISFSMADPRGRILVADFKKSEKNHEIHISAKGDYKFCFDNTFSAFNTKTVYFELAVTNDEDDRWDTDVSFDDTQKDIQQIEGFQSVMDMVRNNLNKARSLQDLIKVTESKDRNIAEEMYFKVNRYSMLILSTMVFVSFVQIVMLKSIFDSNSKIHKVLSFLDFNKY